MNIFKIALAAFLPLIVTQAQAADPVKLELPPGFKATVFANGVGEARHLAVRKNGDVYITVRRAGRGEGVIGLRDSDGDGVADRRVAFGHKGGTGAAIYENYLFFSSDDTVYRMQFTGDELAPPGEMEVVVSGFPRQGAHAAKSLAISALPPGFKATVFANGVGEARHLAVRKNGDVYITVRRAGRGEGVIGLRDSDGDGVADRRVAFGHKGGTGAAIYENYLFFSSDDTVYRMQFTGDELAPPGEMEVVVSGFPRQGAHAAKSLAISADGDLFVNSGAPSNACQKSGRTPGSPGQNPCPHLFRGGGIWKFSADRLNQDQMADGQRYVTGIRNSVALAFDDPTGELYFVMHGRDQLDTLWPRFFSANQREELPAEEFHVALQNSDYGWPYTYYDGLINQRMVGPEYGGDGKKTAPQGRYPEPLAVFPAHWAPNGLVFYHAAQFPTEYKGGAFVAFHGSWNRAPGPQAGYRVVFVPMQDGKPTGDWYTFADGFMGDRSVRTRAQAKHRPVGLAVGPDGSLYVSDSAGGTIWKISYSTAD